MNDCPTCNNTGEVDCFCGGDICVCGKDILPCPDCDGCCAAGDPEELNFS